MPYKNLFRSQRVMRRNGRLKYLVSGKVGEIIKILASIAVRLRRLFPHQAERSIIVYLTLENDD